MTKNNKLALSALTTRHTLLMARYEYMIQRKLSTLGVSDEISKVRSAMEALSTQK